MRHVTIKDVAAAASVSVGTASKALNGRGQLRAETRARVLRATEQLGFVPNALAQSLVGGRSFSVALISPETFGRLSLEVMFGAQEALGNEQIPVLMGEIRGDPHREQRYLETFAARRVDGLIVAGRNIESVQALRASPAFSVVHALGRPAGEGVSALPDVESGARMAAEHLLAIGRRRIAHITGPQSMPAARLQARGFISALKAAGAEPCDSVMYGHWGESWGREAAGRLLPGQPDAIFCGSDQIARGAADTLRALGRRIPDDVALVGCGNWGPAVLGALPELTSVDMCLEEVGRVAARCLLAILAGEAPQGVHRVPAQLVVRQSSGGGGEARSGDPRHPHSSCSCSDPPHAGQPRWIGQPAPWTRAGM
jgi:DNA-binding LacI/PurR family transcriptional regulator